jgi:hypothetical protein
MSRQEVLRVNHSVFVTYVFPQKTLPKTLTFKDEGKMRELAPRSETSAQPASLRPASRNRICRAK